ncbi:MULTISPECIES: glycerol kinase GlpK [Flavobacterium]|uniref:Glycerol kinase n=1 Tax=Flavobacterium cupriresistens TaxID=2893885 RepID=A0ABU4R8D8_9FLAO|nr:MULTISPECIES: glycerol kinase GlpK [unclassified Flavobacterium]KLT68419.1 glycerol kinase [Flavobacterium sp. ABG]MDX6188856.1 glycerol kinase GlpK [Flavobacterium sp. Fl-318]UFH44360.1 glycerol kinase GlpK [Flavobacterium sp. F-323]
MQNKLILTLDQGTTSSRAIVFNHDGEIVSISQKPYEQIFPKPGWVEHDPNEIWSSQISVAAEVIAKVGISGREIAAIGITNQRETTIVWDRETSEPLYNAIVWQDRRTAKYCDELKAKGHSDMIQEKTGLILDAYFSGTKLKWILDHVEGAREKAEQGKLCFGTVDTWLIWKLTRGKMFMTDVSNASRTLLLNIHTLEWDDELLELFDIPRAMLPEVKQSSEIYGETSTTLFSSKIPISGVAGDQQAALFGQLCTEPGMMKNTYGTGCFMLMNTGDKPVYSKNNLLTTIAWKINGKTTYALEGSVFVGGAAVQWLRDGAKMINSSDEIEALAASVPDNGGVYFVPALTGLGAPHWDQYARGAILGITRGTTSAHIARATLEGIAYQVYDLAKSMEADSGNAGTELRVDGGAVVNNLMMQFQSDLFGFKVIRPKTLETTALGAAYLAGLAVGYWKSVDELQKQWSVDRVFSPEMPKTEVDQLVHNWNKAVGRTTKWIED